MENLENVSEKDQTNPNNDNWKEEGRCCQWWYKDFCPCINRQNRDRKKGIRDKLVKATLKYLEKKEILFSNTKIENTILTEYWGDKYYISLKTFKFRKEGTKKWIEKKKTKWFTMNTTFKFGKYKDKKVKDVIDNDKSYFTWMMDKTDMLLNNEIIKKITQ